MPVDDELVLGLATQPGACVCARQVASELDDVRRVACLRSLGEKRVNQI